MATPSGHPGRTLIVLGVIIAAMYGLMAISNNWTPKLGLDLQGGTTITLTAANSSGTGQVDPTSLQLAKTIIQSRVDSLGVGESEVTTSGNNQIVVSVPNVQQDELVQLVGQTAQLRFRAVYDVQQVTPPSDGELVADQRGHRCDERRAYHRRDGAVHRRREQRAECECLVAGQPDRRGDQRRAKSDQQRHRQRTSGTGPADRPRHSLLAATLDIGLGHATGQGDRLATERHRHRQLRRVHL